MRNKKAPMQLLKDSMMNSDYEPSPEMIAKMVKNWRKLPPSSLKMFVKNDVVHIEILEQKKENNEKRQSFFNGLCAEN